MSYNRKIKILFISHSSMFYGSEQSLFSLLKNIDRNAFEPIVLFPDHSGLLVQKVKAMGIACVFSYSPWWIGVLDKANLAINLIEEIGSVEAVVNIIKEYQIDVVYTNTILKINGGIAARQCGIPHIYHVREILETQQLNSLFDVGTTFKLIDFLSDQIIVVSNAVKKQLLNYCTTHKINMVYNGVEHLLFQNDQRRREVREKYQLEEDTFLIAIIGSIQSSKGHEDLIKAFQEVVAHSKKAKLMIVGEGFESYVAYLKQLIQSLKIEGNVIFTGFITDIFEIMVAIDLLIVASMGEPFGRTTIEAMAFGKPVIATNTGASPELILDGVTGYLVPPRNPEALANSIIKVLSDHDKSREMGEQGKIRAITEFSIERYVADVERVLCKISDFAKERKELNRDGIIAKFFEIAGAKGFADMIKFAASKSLEVKAELRSTIKDMENQINSIKNTFSWRITRPLRIIGDLIGLRRGK